MQYKVINYFTDLKDNNFAYNVGDIFPREGLVVGEDRIAELSGSNNLQKKPLIKAVEETATHKKATTKKSADK